MLKAKLVVVGGEASEAEVDLRLPTIIGRGREVTLTVPHALVSRRHAEIFERDGQLFVRDLGSLNGTFVDNQKIGDDHPLNPEQLLTLGNITFRAVYEFGHEVGETEIANAHETAKVKFDALDIAPDADQVLAYDQETVPVDSLNESNQAQKNPTDVGKHQDTSPSKGVARQFSSLETLNSSTPLQPANRVAGAIEKKHEPAVSRGLPLDTDPAIEVAGQEEVTEGSISAISSDVGSFLRKLPK